MADGWLKPRLTVDFVARLIADQFAEWQDLQIRPVKRDGWDNTTFRLGDDMSVRLPSHEAYAAQVDKEQIWLPRLAPHLPLPVPVPLAKGIPTDEYPLPWSVYRWLDGEPANTAQVDDKTQLAVRLGEFLAALEQIDTTGSPPPGSHNFFRGGDLSVYDEQTRTTVAKASATVDTALAIEVWEAALAARWSGVPVWVHGDVAPGNLLVDHGELCGVIDFGCACVGDPACDLVIAWTFLENASREAFRNTVAMDDATWARGRGWALWKALITLDRDVNAGQVVDAVLLEHELLSS